MIYLYVLDKKQGKSRTKTLHFLLEPFHLQTAKGYLNKFSFDDIRCPGQMDLTKEPRILHFRNKRGQIVLVIRENC